MFCSKFGGECQHPVSQNDKFVFVIMPFKGFDNIYDAIKLAVEDIEEKNFICERADERYTNLSIWCERICKNIRKAKYLIVDTTGKNPNVFYELGFAHAMDNTKAILITQNISDAPFDIADINHIKYSVENFRELREKLKNAIVELEKKEVEEGYANKSSEQVIADLKSDLRKEEERSSKFKKELNETEERERKLKERIKEMEAAQNNPVEEAKSRIFELGGTIGKLNSELKYTKKDKKETIEQLKKTLEEKEEKLKTLEKRFDEYMITKDVKPLSDSLLLDSKRHAESQKWFNKAYDEAEKGDKEKAIEYYTKAIELDLKYAIAYYNRGNAYYDRKEYDKAISDYNKAIELDPKYATAYNNRGNAYSNRKEYDKAISDYNKAIELDPRSATAYQNLSELNIITGSYGNALENIAKALSLSNEIEDRTSCIYLELIAKKMLNRDLSECEKEFNEILKTEFTATWSFDGIESWLKDADISAEKKAFIVEKTEQFKKHKR